MTARQVPRGTCLRAPAQSSCGDPPETRPRFRLRPSLRTLCSQQTALPCLQGREAHAGGAAGACRVLGQGRSGQGRSARQSLHCFTGAGVDNDLGWLERMGRGPRQRAVPERCRRGTERRRCAEARVEVGVRQAVDSATGKVIWKTYTIAEAAKPGETVAHTPGSSRTRRRCAPPPS